MEIDCDKVLHHVRHLREKMQCKELDPFSRLRVSVAAHGRVHSTCNVSPLYVNVRGNNSFLFRLEAEFHTNGRYLCRAG